MSSQAPEDHRTVTCAEEGLPTGTMPVDCSQCQRFG